MQVKKLIKLSLIVGVILATSFGTINVVNGMNGTATTAPQAETEKPAESQTVTTPSATPEPVAPVEATPTESTEPVQTPTPPSDDSNTTPTEATTATPTPKVSAPPSYVDTSHDAPGTIRVQGAPLAPNDRTIVGPPVTIKSSE